MSGLLDPPPLLAGDDPQNVDSRQVDVDRAAEEGGRGSVDLGFFEYYYRVDHTCHLTQSNINLKTTNTLTLVT